MAECEVCGNDYDKAIEVRMNDISHVFDSFECAIYALAPRCSQCDCPIIGHGVEVDEKFYCGANCARKTGESRITDRTDSSSAERVA